MNTKAIATVSAAALAIAAPSAAMAAQVAPAQPAQQAIFQNAEAAQPSVLVSAVEGSFGFSQNALTSNTQIKTVFQKVAASICNVLPAYDSIAADLPIAISGDIDSPFAASISEMAKAKGSSVQVMTCACTSNSVGGAAIATAEVEGVSIADIAEIAGL